MGRLSDSQQAMVDLFERLEESQRPQQMTDVDCSGGAQASLHPRPSLFHNN